jgi:hypothetical protein
MHTEILQRHGTAFPEGVQFRRMETFCHIRQRAPYSSPLGHVLPRLGIHPLGSFDAIARIALGEGVANPPPTHSITHGHLAGRGNGERLAAIREIKSLDNTVVAIHVTSSVV